MFYWYGVWLKFKLKLMGFKSCIICLLSKNDIGIWFELKKNINLKCIDYVYLIIGNKLIIFYWYIYK